LSQILWNLLSNASKYCPAQTPVLISAIPSEHETPLPSSPPSVCICVKDSGPGIPPAEIPHLFAPFARLKRDVSMSIPGSGLGLSISKHMVQAMGGEMWVESSGVAGEGSCFSFTLPAAFTFRLLMSSQEAVITSKKKGRRGNECTVEC